MKKKLLHYGDAPTAATGFGTVSRNVLHAIHQTGEWDITVRGVNYFSTAHDYPYQILPAGFPETGDPFGKKAFLRDLLTQDFDLVLVNNDLYVLEDMTADLTKILENKKAKLIVYYPVDRSVTMTGFIKLADQAVAYTRFGHAETAKVMDASGIAIIPHGCDTFPRITAEERKQWRAQAFNVGSDDTFCWITVNRNSVRKDIARSLEAFAAFHEYQPDSRFYVHCQQQDNGLDMGAAAADLGISKVVAFPAQFSLSNGGMPRDMLSRVMQLGDAFLTTHLGEGFGLTVTEAMAEGLPVVAPRNTTMPEILGENYPYLYDCRETAYVDNSGYRPRGTVRDIFAAMKLVHDHNGNDALPSHRTIAIGAQERNDAWVRENSWENVGKMWIAIIDHVLATPKRTAQIVEVV